MWEASLLLNPCCPAGRGVMAVVPRGPAPDLPSHRDALRVDPINSELKPRPPSRSGARMGSPPEAGSAEAWTPCLWEPGFLAVPLYRCRQPPLLKV